MTLTLAKIGGWAFGDLVLHDELNHLQNELIKAIDGTGGGVYTLHDADLQLSTDAAKKFILDLGAQLNAGKTFDVEGVLSLASGAALNALAGSGISVSNGAFLSLLSGSNFLASTGSIMQTAGELDISAPGILKVLGVLQVRSGGDFQMLTGSTAEIAGGVTMQSGSLAVLQSGAGLSLDNGAALTIHNLNDFIISDVGGFNVGSWTSKLTPHFAETGWFLSDSPTIHWWENSDTSAARRLQFDLPLKQGDEVTSIICEVNVQTFHVSLPATKPVVTLFRVDSGGNRHNLASRADPSITLGAYETLHSFTIDATHVDSGSMPQTLNADRYYIEITGETGANAVNDALQLISLGGVSRQRSFRTQAEVL